jgi:hypothetical protein
MGGVQKTGNLPFFNNHLVFREMRYLPKNLTGGARQNYTAISHIKDETWRHITERERVYAFSTSLGSQRCVAMNQTRAAGPALWGRGCLFQG